MTKIILTFPVRPTTPISCVWYATGNPARPLACKWIPAEQADSAGRSAAAANLRICNCA